MKSNVANTTNRPDGLMTRLKAGVSKPLRTVILSGAALLAPDIAENVLPHSGGDPYALHAAEEPQETESNSKEAKAVELARVDNATKKNEADKVDLDIYETPAWKEFSNSLKPAQKYLKDLLQQEIAEAKEKDFSDHQIAAVIEYGLDKTIPENVVFGVSMMSAGFGTNAAMETKDIKKFYSDVALIGDFDSFKPGVNGREKVFNFVTNYAFNRKTGIMFSKMADLALRLKHREGDEVYRKRVLDALYKADYSESVRKSRSIYLLN